MKLIGIGIDVVEVERVKSSMDEFGSRFVQRLFTPAEQEYCERQQRPELHYAARFAAKEAVAKAFGTGIGKAIGWLEMEIVRRQSGEPEVVLSGGAIAYAAERGITQINVSLTHAKHYAAANAIVLGK